MNTQNKEFTGKHFLIAMIIFFGLIFAANIVLVNYALRSWSGLVVPNSYVQSQDFNKKVARAAAQSRLNWHGKLSYASGAIRFSFKDENAGTVYADSVVLKIGRPTNESEDKTLELVYIDEGIYAVPLALGPGRWKAHITAYVPQEVEWKKNYRFFMTQEGVLKDALY